METPSLSEQKKILAAYKRRSALWSALFYIFTAVAVAGLLGAVVVVLVFEFKDGFSSALSYILLGSFAAAALVGAPAACLFARLLSVADEKRLDFEERCDSPYSFYVGEGTLATFGEDGLVVHGGPQSKRICVPYAEARFFSVCTRRAPREKGDWCVAIELPARYLTKDKRSAEKILVQADAKERLFSALAACSLPLLGEKKGEGKGKKFTLKAKFLLPVPQKRRRALLFGILGAAAAAGGIAAAFWNAAVGSILTVIGLFAATRSFLAFARAKGELSFYEEGLFWKDPNGSDRIFLKWDEIERVSRGTEKEGRGWEIRCAYGAYNIPDVAGAYEYLQEKFPQKCDARRGEGT